MRTLRLEQVGQLEVGEGFACERLASGHLLFWGVELERALLLDPSFARIERLPRWTHATHAGERLAAELDSEGDIHVIGASGAELARIEARGDVGGLRFDASGVVLWELAERRPWEVRARVARDGRLIGRVALPDPDPALQAWHIDAVRPVADGLVVSSFSHHVAITLAPAGLTLHALAIDSFVDWMPGARGFLAHDEDGGLAIHRWPDGAPVRPVGTDRVRELLGDAPGTLGRVVDDERALMAVRGRLVVIDLVDPGAQILDLRLDGDARPDGFSLVELGRTGRVITARRDDAVLKIWDGREAVRTIPARRRGLR